MRSSHQQAVDVHTIISPIHSIGNQGHPIYMHLIAPHTELLSCKRLTRHALPSRCNQSIASFLNAGIARRCGKVRPLSPPVSSAILLEACRQDGVLLLCCTNWNGTTRHSTLARACRARRASSIACSALAARRLPRERDRRPSQRWRSRSPSPRSSMTSGLLIT
jgi:hypothetical protein